MWRYETGENCSTTSVLAESKASASKFLRAFKPQLSLRAGGSDNDSLQFC